MEERKTHNSHEEPHHERARLADVVPLSHPYILMIDPCGICNFRCCFCPCNISSENKEQRHKMMPMELFEKIVSDLKEFPEKINAVDLYGFGEPLLNKKLPEMIALLKRENVCGKVRLATNASLLDEEMARKLVEAGLDYVKISLEALDDAGYQELCGVSVKFGDIVNRIRGLYNISHEKPCGGVLKSA